MTSPTSAARPDSHDAHGDESLGRAARRSLCSRGSRRPSRHAFTVVELLVVIGIIVILASILIPTVMKMQKTGARTRQAMDFQTIGTALQAYHQDFGAYPMIEPPANGVTPATGAEVLVEALVGPAPAISSPNFPNGPFDGADGPGFRVRAGSAVKGPYLPPDKFKIKYANTTGNPDDPARDRPAGFYDIWGERVILYYPASPAKINVAPGSNGPAAGAPQHPYVDDLANPIPNGRSRAETMFNYNDNAAAPDAATLTLEKFRALLGDANNDGWINTSAGENALAGDKAFILLSAGPDRAFGPPSTKAEDVEACDDVTNLK